MDMEKLTKALNDNGEPGLAIYMERMADIKKRFAKFPDVVDNNFINKINEGCKDDEDGQNGYIEWFRMYFSDNFADAIPCRYGLQCPRALSELGFSDLITEWHATQNHHLHNSEAANIYKINVLDALNDLFIKACMDEQAFKDAQELLPISLWTLHDFKGSLDFAKKSFKNQNVIIASMNYKELKAFIKRLFTLRSDYCRDVLLFNAIDAACDIAENLMHV